MSIILRQKIDINCTTLAIWKIEEELSSIKMLCTSDEVAQADLFSSERRQIEWLAWHALLHAITPNIVTSHNEKGAPIIESGDNKHIGVSHTTDYVAVIVSNRPCAVDIELLSRNFSKAATRYICEEENALAQTLGDNFMGLLWCAKETLYKWARHTEIDLLNDIRIESINSIDSTIIGEIKGDKTTLHYFQLDDICVVYCYE